MGERARGWRGTEGMIGDTTGARAMTPLRSSSTAPGGSTASVGDACVATAWRRVKVDGPSAKPASVTTVGAAGGPCGTRRVEEEGRGGDVKESAAAGLG